MGSLPTPSVLKGPHRSLCDGGEPVLLHHIFQNTVAALDKLNNNNTTDDPVKMIHSIDLNEALAQQTALVGPSETTTFAELNAAANRLARALLQKTAGVEANADGDFLVAVCMRPSRALVTVLLAVWKAGAAYLPLDVSFPRARIRHILEESRPVLTVVHDFQMDEDLNFIEYAELEKIGADLSGSDLSETETLTKDVPQEKVVAAVLYTSGSTGVPKGVRILHSAILNRLKWQWRTFPYSSTEKVCVFKTALTFVDSVCELWGPLLNARSVLVLSKEDTKNPETLVGLLRKHQVERLILVPTLLHSILLFGSIKGSDDFLPRLRLWVCSGEALSVSLARQFFQFFGSQTHILCNFYGSTEIMGDVTYHVLRGMEDVDAENKIPIGFPLDNTTVYILDKDLHPVNVNEVGELFVSGWNLAAGYVNKRDPDKFLDNPLAVDPGHSKLYRTGDYAKIVKNTVYYEGRTDSQIKVRGHRVDLSEIESALEKMNEVDKHIVLTYKPGDVNQAVLAFVTIKSEATERDIEEHLAAVLAPYMVPQVILVNSFPLLVNGKVDRQYLLQKYKCKHGPEEGPDRKDGIVDYSGVESGKRRRAEALFETVAGVLGQSLRGSVRSDANFFALGGNSLNSVLTVTKLRDLGYVISIGNFISSATLSDVIDKMEEERLDPSLNPVQVCPSKNSGLPSSPKYEFQLLGQNHKEDVFNIITSSFYEKADLEKLLVPPVPVDDYTELLNALWPHLLEKNLSFIVKDGEEKVKGAALNFDAHDEPEIVLSPSNRLNIVFEFLEFLEGPIRTQKLPKGKNKILHSFMMGTRTDLPPQETIEIFLFMEEQVIKLAKTNNFEGVFTSNTNELTQQLGCDVNNYTSLLNYQVNKYVAPDGSKPFAAAPDSQRTIVSWKTV